MYRVLRRHLTPQAFTVRPCSFSATPAAETLTFSSRQYASAYRRALLHSLFSLAMHLVRCHHSQHLALAVSANRAADGLYPAAKNDNTRLSSFAAV